jgi:hypothetical protein
MTLKMPGESVRVQFSAAYARLERPISSISLLGGFAFDALTLKRVDTFRENFWIVAHLVVVAVCILLLNRTGRRGRSENLSQTENLGGTEKLKGAEGVNLTKNISSTENINLTKNLNRTEGSDSDANPPNHNGLSPARFWLINTLQFFFGGLLSTFLVFYFRSGSLRASWPFFVILGAAFAANEKLKAHYARLAFQISFFFLSLFCFMIYILPVLLHSIGRLIFLLSGVVSLGLVYLFLRILQWVAGQDFSTRSRALHTCITVIFITINVFYFLNLIPPIPLSLQDASVHHAITRSAEGNYSVQSEDPGRLRYFRLVDTFHATPGESVYAYSAIFSPTSLNTKILHEWQFYEPKRGWTTLSRVELPVRGGRGGGYRTYSVKTGITAGAWRVNVETPSGALLGRLRFNVVLQDSDPPLVTQLKN